jgi:hypothetical protein
VAIAILPKIGTELMLEDTISASIIGKMADKERYKKMDREIMLKINATIISVLMESSFLSIFVIAVHSYYRLT